MEDIVEIFDRWINESQHMDGWDVGILCAYSLQMDAKKP